MRHDPASTAVVVMLRSLKMYGMAQAVSDLTEQGAPAFDTAVPILSQLLKAELAEREVRSVAYQIKAARFDDEIMNAPGISGRLHAQLAGRVTAQEITLDPATFHHGTSACDHALVVKGRTSLAAQHKGVFLDVDVIGPHLLAQRVDQKTALAVERTAADGLHEVSQQTGGQGGLKQHGALGGGDLARIQPAERTLGGVATNLFG